MIKFKPNLTTALATCFSISAIATALHYKSPTIQTYELNQPAVIASVETVPINTASARSGHSRDITPTPTPASKTDSTTPNIDCEITCQNRIVNLLGSKTKLSPSDANLIIENPSLFAPLLAANPEALARLLSRLQEDEGENDHAQFAAQAILIALSDEARLAAGQSLLGSADASFRVLGIKLSKDNLTHNAQASRDFDLFIRQEKHTHVLIAAINALSETDTPGPYASETITGLNHLINFHDSDNIRGNALVAKAKLVQSTSIAKTDIQNALLSPSPELQELGLQAFSIARERDAHQPSQKGKWTNDKTSIDALKTMINNTELDSDTRQLAGELTNFN